MTAVWLRDPIGILADGAERDLVVDNGRIVERVLAGTEPATSGAAVLDAGRHVVLPGLINRAAAGQPQLAWRAGRPQR
jgi:8-oxoguanine deaminase